MSNFCPNCGAKIREDAKFCASCGQKISVDSSPKIELKKSSPAQLDAPPTSPLQENYSPPEDTTPHYKEDVTIREIFLTSEGRLNRWRYFCRSMMLAAPALLLYLILLGLDYGNSADGAVGALGVLFYCLFMIVPSVMLAVRRLHDLNKSGWYYLAIFVPFVNLPFSLYVIFAPGTVGANKYGADPLENKRR